MKGINPMKQIKLFTFFLLVLISISCLKKPEAPIGSNKIVIQGTTVDTIKANLVVVKSYANNGGFNSITEHGFCWGTTTLPDLSGPHTSLGTLPLNGQFSSELKGLLSATEYYIRAYAKDNYSLNFGTQSQFTTLAYVAPLVNTTDATLVTAISAQCGGDVISDGNGMVLTRGVCWDTTINPTLYNCINKTQDGAGKGIFTSQINNLVKSTTYYVRAYAINEKDSGYGEVKSFTTITIYLPTVNTSAVSKIWDSTAICGGDVVTDGNTPVTGRGVCWSLSMNPTINNNHTADGVGTGSYVSNLSNLVPNSKYYIRSYATNSEGTGYGNEISFTTLLSQQYHIGQQFGGGIIFYIDDSRIHGLIAAPSNQSDAAPWGCSNTTIGGTSTDIGTGQANTTLIVNKCSTDGTAARICDNLFLNGYGDWFLPSKDELNQMNLQQEMIGGLTSGFYWSSSESTYNASLFAHLQAFSSGSQYTGRKYDLYFVRAIRAF